MKDIRSQWPKSSSLLQLRKEALYTMKCFTFVQSTPDSKVGELLQDAFFKRSASQSFPILSNLGIRDSKDVREPHADFQPFIKEVPILDDELWPVNSTIIEQLPKGYRVTAYRFRDVQDELKHRAFTEEEILMVQHGKCTDTNWTMIEMEAGDGQTAMPKPFDLSRFLCTAVTFLAKVEKITILFNGQRLSEITKSRGKGMIIEDLPKDLKTKRDAGFMHVQSVHRIPQQVRVDLTKLAYSAGSKTSAINKTVPDEQDADPAKRPSFFEGFLKKPESHCAAPVSPNLLHTNTSVVNYTIYSAHISSTPSEDIISGLQAATKKKPPTSFLFEAVHFSMDEHQQVMQDRNEEGSIGSVFRGVQALCGEEGDQSFPILSNLGIRHSKDVREPHADFQPFIKEGPILDEALWPVNSTIIEQLPEGYRVKAYRFRDVHDELKCRVFTEEEMVACVRWWLNTRETCSKQMSGKEMDATWRKELLPWAKFHSSSQTPPRVIALSTVEMFVDPTLESFLLQDSNLLPHNTIPLSFTEMLDAKQDIATLGWKPLTIIDWIIYLVDPSRDIFNDPALLENVFVKLGKAWSSI
ncbi:hypothetical protein BDN67DRAFT_1053660, partial [Paxillus ammoniavirescens]